MFFIIRYEHCSGEVVSILGPRVSVEYKMIRIVDDIKLRVSWELCLKYLHNSIWKLGFSILFEIFFVAAKDFCSTLGVTSDVLFVHGPDGLKDIENVQYRPILCRDFRRTLYCFLLEITSNLTLSKDNVVHLVQNLNVFVFFLFTLVE